LLIGTNVRKMLYFQNNRVDILDRKQNRKYAVEI